MNITEEIEQVIIRTIISKGIDSIPQDYYFLHKYNIMELYFMGCKTGTPTYNKVVKQGLVEKLSQSLIETDFPLLREYYRQGGKKEVMTYLKNEIYYRTFYKAMKSNGK